MAKPSDETERDRRVLARKRAERDIARRERRVPGGDFLRSLALIGSVGWPIAALSAGGAFLGHELDRRLGTHALGAGIGLGIGAALGSYAAYRAVDGGKR